MTPSDRRTEVAADSETEVPAAAGTAPLLWAAISLLLLHLALVALFWLRWFAARYRVDGVESTVLNTVLLWKAGFPPYSHLDRIPEGWSPYGPLYQWLCTLLPKPENPYLPGRILSLGALLGTAGIIVAVARQRTGNWLATLVVVPLLLTARPVQVFGLVGRVDMLAIALGMGGLVLVTTSGRRGAWAAGVMLLSLAVQVKLSALIAPAAAVLALAPRSPRRAAGVALGCLALAGSGVWLTQRLSEGAYLYDLGLLTQDSPRLSKAFDMMTRPLTSSPFWVLAVVVGWIRLGRGERRDVWPWLVYTGMALVGAGITAMHPGSSWNYLLEFYAALGLLTAALLARHLRAGRRPGDLRVIAGLLAAHGLFAIWYSTQITYRKKYARELPQREQAVAWMRQQLEPIVARGTRIALLRTEDGVDALLSFGRYNPVDFPPSGFRRQQEALLRRALREGSLDAVLAGDDLHAWPGEGQRARGSAGP